MQYMVSVPGGDNLTTHTHIGPTADDVTFYGKVRRSYPRNRIVAANDNTPRALLLYRNSPDHPPEPLQSNWSTAPRGIVEYDMGGEGRGNVVRLYPDLNLEVVPSIEKIIEAMRGEWVWAEPEVHTYGKKKGQPKATTGPLQSIGDLVFSNGSQTEKAYTRGPDGDVISYNRNMERGAMLRSSEETGAVKGGGKQSSAVELSNQLLTHMLLGKDAAGNRIEPAPTVRKYIRSGKMTKGKSLTAEASRALIAEAIANTPVMPQVKKCPPGLPMGTAKASNCFIGMRPQPSGKSGASIGWVDFFIAGQERREWLAVLGEIDETTQTVLETALHAGSYAEVGLAAGQSLSYARTKGGKLALKAANDNLDAVIKKVAL